MSTERRMRAHIIITLIVFWAISEHYGAGFSVVTLGPVQVIVPNWAAFLALALGIDWLRRGHILGAAEGWMRWVLVGDYTAYQQGYAKGVDDGIDGTLALYDLGGEPATAVTERIERY